MQKSGERNRKSVVETIFLKITLFLIFLYQNLISPLKFLITGSYHSCRFTPSCSEYAKLCFLNHGVIKGLYLTLSRLLKCHPFNEGGYNPPPNETHDHNG